VEADQTSGRWGQTMARTYVSISRGRLQPEETRLGAMAGGDDVGSGGRWHRNVEVATTRDAEAVAAAL
jgi:hypothetical protein